MPTHTGMYVLIHTSIYTFLSVELFIYLMSANYILYYFTIVDMFLKMSIDSGLILTLMVMATSHGTSTGTGRMGTCQV